MGSEEKKNFIKLFFFLINGGAFVLRKVFQNQINACGKSLSDLLRQNRDKIKNMIKRKLLTETQFDLLFPTNKQDADIEQWDISLLTLILLHVFDGVLDVLEIAAVKDIREARNVILAHRANSEMTDMEFIAHWRNVSDIMNNLSTKMTAEDQKHLESIKSSIYNDPFQKCTVEQLSELGQTDQLVQSVTEQIMPLIKSTMLEYEKTSQARLDECMKKLSDIEKEVTKHGNQQMQHGRKIELLTRMHVKAGSKRSRQQVQEHILEASKYIISKGSNVDNCDDEVSSAVEDFLTGIEEQGVKVVKADNGSILFTVLCPTIQSMRNTTHYLKSQQLQHKLSYIEKVVDAKYTCTSRITVHVDIESLELTTKKLEEEIDAASVYLTLECSGVTGVRKAVHIFENGESSNTFNKLSEALSRTVGETVELQAEINIDKLESEIEKINEMKRNDSETVIGAKRQKLEIEMSSSTSKPIQQEDLHDSNTNVTGQTLMEEEDSETHGEKELGTNRISRSFVRPKLEGGFGFDKYSFKYRIPTRGLTSAHADQNFNSESKVSFTMMHRQQSSNTPAAKSVSAKREKKKEVKPGNTNNTDNKTGDHCKTMFENKPDIPEMDTIYPRKLKEWELQSEPSEVPQDYVDMSPRKLPTEQRMKFSVMPLIRQKPEQQTNILISAKYADKPEGDDFGVALCTYNEYLKYEKIYYRHFFEEVEPNQSASEMKIKDDDELVLVNEFFVPVLTHTEMLILFHHVKVDGKTRLSLVIRRKLSRRQEWEWIETSAVLAPEKEKDPPAVTDLRYNEVEGYKPIERPMSKHLYKIPGTVKYMDIHDGKVQFGIMNDDNNKTKIIWKRTKFWQVDSEGHIDFASTLCDVTKQWFIAIDHNGQIVVQLEPVWFKMFKVGSKIRFQFHDLWLLGYDLENNKLEAQVTDCLFEELPAPSADAVDDVSASQKLDPLLEEGQNNPHQPSPKLSLSVHTEGKSMNMQVLRQTHDIKAISDSAMGGQTCFGCLPPICVFRRDRRLHKKAPDEETRIVILHENIEEEFEATLRTYKRRQKDGSRYYRHFLIDILENGPAGLMGIEDYDELLVLDDDEVPDKSHNEVLCLFRNVKVDGQTRFSLVIRRKPTRKWIWIETSAILAPGSLPVFEGQPVAENTEIKKLDNKYVEMATKTHYKIGGTQLFSDIKNQQVTADVAPGIDNDNTKIICKHERNWQDSKGQVYFEAALCDESEKDFIGVGSKNEISIKNEPEWFQMQKIPIDIIF